MKATRDKAKKGAKRAERRATQRAAKSRPRARAKPSSAKASARPVAAAPKTAKRLVAMATATSAARTAKHSVAPAPIVAKPEARIASGSEAAAKGRYVYCIIRTDQPLTFGAIGIGDEPAPVYTVRYEDLSAVVSDTPLGVLDPTRDNVLAHQRVNETVMREHTVLPMSFGTMFKTRDDVTAFLKSAYRAFSDVIDKMEAKLEFGLKVLWDRDAVIREIEHEDDDIRRLKNEIAAQKGSTYFARMQYGRLIDQALQTKSERYVAEIFERLRDVSVAARANKPIGDRMILNAAFLVSRESEDAFDARVKALGGTHDKLTFKYTGPWPPYNFVNIRLKLERA
jgi:hypothetical protein